MLRVLHRLVLRAHPPYFRQRFAEEVQSIFDQAENGLAEAALLADAIGSLLRQWALRPQFWQESPLAVAGQGVPLFSSLESNKPRTAALIYGAFVSALVLNGVCWTMGYAWNHPIFIELRRPVIVPPASWKTKTQNAPAGTETNEDALYSDQGRVVLIFTTHAHAAADPAAGDNSSALPSTPPSAAVNLSSKLTVPSAGLLQSYAGTYISTSSRNERVNVTFVGGGLHLDIVGVFSSPLTPLSNAPVLACGGKCWVRFWANATGTVDQIEVHYSGREIQAFRLQGAVF